MPRKRKGTSIQQALDFLRSEGVEVEVHQIHAKEIPKPKLQPEHLKESPTEMRIALGSRHQIGDMVYGPGYVTVSSELASSLLYADQRAAEYDREFFSNEFKEYLIVQYQGNGTSAYRGMRVPSGFVSGLDPTKLHPNQIINFG